MKSRRNNNYSFKIHFINNIVKCLPVFYLLLPIFVSPTSAAEIIQIKTTTSASVNDDKVKIIISYSNNGNASAIDVMCKIFLLNEKIEGSLKPLLKPNESETITFEKPVKIINEGRYPLTVFIDFHDANHYPFTALSCTTFFYKKDVNADLIIKGTDISLDKNEKLNFDIKNLGNEQKQIKAILILPKELSSTKPNLEFQINSRSEQKISFDIINFSALAGASYPLFCNFEYELKGLHYTTIGISKVIIAKPENWFRRTNTLWVGLTMVLVVIFIFSILRDHEKLTKFPS